MKTKNLLIILVFTLWCVVEAFAQNNTILTSVVASPGEYNTCIGYQSGMSIVNGASPTVFANLFAGSFSGRNNTTGFSNCFLGYYSGYHNSTGKNNVFIGHFSGYANQVGHSNAFIGINSGYNNTNGYDNSFYGEDSGLKNTTGNQNTFIGSNAGYNNTSGYNNIFVGASTGFHNTTGKNNTFVGYYSGYNISSGYNNTFLGIAQVNSSASTATSTGFDTNGTIIIADSNPSSPKQRLFIHNNGFAGLNTGNNVIPKNTLEIKAHNYSPTQSGFTASGLRLASLTNTNFNTTPPTSNRQVLTVNGNGDVILVDDLVGTGGSGVTQNCSTANFVPLNNTTTNQLICSQIYDNSTSSGIGTSVGIGYSTATDANAAFPTSLVTGAWFSTSNTNYSSYTNFRLAVNGITRADGYLATSDKKYKKDIKAIENALTTIEKLEGKTYLWDRESNKDKNFDGGGHSGFIAQDLEKVLPHLVATGDNGDKAVNYMELMPYLVEAIKEQNSIIKDQQTQINDLKQQITENFKAQNQDLIELTNTKIINVSPNPSNDIITVSFNVEKPVQSAKLQVHDLNGNVISSLNISDRENNITRTLQKDNFGKGIYVVSLVINGKSIDTKKIVFN